MKLLRKLLAAVTVTALALTMLVGCGSDGGDSKKTFATVDYLNDVVKMAGGTTEFKADTALDTNAKNAVAVLQSVGATTIEELVEKATDAQRDQLAAAMGVKGADKEKYYYQLSFAQIDLKLTTDAAKDMQGLMEAESLMSNVDSPYIPEAARYEDDGNGWHHDNADWSKLASTTYVGTATMKLGNKSYLVAVFRTEVTGSSSSNAGNSGFSGGHGGGASSGSSNGSSSEASSSEASSSSSADAA